VLLPLPLGPVIATNSPVAMSRSTSPDGQDGKIARGVDAGELAAVDHAVGERYARHLLLADAQQPEVD